MMLMLKRCLAFMVIFGMSIYVTIQIHQYRIAIVGWEMYVSRNTNEYIFPNNSTTLLKPHNFCNTKSYLMVFICSSPFHFQARHVIRQTWGLSKNISNTVVNIYFLLGLTTDLYVQEKVEIESEKYNDIIQENFMDSYNNLTLKSLMILKLVINDCNNKVRYVMKTDDDVFVNLVALVDNLQDISKSEEYLGVLFGYLMCNIKPVRMPYEKWYLPTYMYDSVTYPNYLSGTGYVMSANVCNRLYEVALETPLIYLEDVYLTGICAKAAGIRPRHNVNFNFKKVKYNPCLFKHLITTHSFLPFELSELYYQMHSVDLEKECVIYMENIQKNITALKLFSKVKISKRKTCF